MRRTRRSPNPVAEELSAYFSTSDAVQGLKSSWDPLTGIALGGFGGSPEQERQITGRRFAGHDTTGHWRFPGDDGDDAIVRAREARSALLELPKRHHGAPSWYDVLYAAYGDTSWEGIIDKWYGTGMASRIRKSRVFPVQLLGVATLLDEVRAGGAELAGGDTLPPYLDVHMPQEPEKKKRVHKLKHGPRSEGTAEIQRTPGGWLVMLCRVALWEEPAHARVSKDSRRTHTEKKEIAVAKLKSIAAAAAVLLTSAEMAYRKARGWKEPEPEAPGPAPKGPRKKEEPATVAPLEPCFATTGGL